MRILDRYIIREILPPLLIGLLVLTFILEIPVILRDAEALIAKGVEWSIVLRVVLTLLPSALALTIPMALLLGILVALGRLSGDREFVAMQACGVSLFRLMRPIAVLAVVATAADAYEMIVALPDGNQSYREIAFGVAANRIENNVKPQVFFQDFPDHVLYVRDTPPRSPWRDVFLADSSHAGQTDVYFAQDGRLLVDRDKRTVELLLTHGTRHTTNISKPDEYQGTSFDSIQLKLNPDTVFPRSPPKGSTEKSIAELKADMAANTARGLPSVVEPFMIQQKFSIPAACLVLALIGLALGVSNRKEGKLASFALGFIVIFIYYVILWSFRALATTGRIPSAPGPWIPNVIFGAAGVALVMWRAGSADEPIRIAIPAFWQKAAGPASAAPRRQVVVVVRVPHINLPRPRLLDLYVSRQYLHVFVLGAFALLGIFYISTFMDLADKLFRGAATASMLLRYFYYKTPWFVYYIIPMAVLLASLVTIGLMTKNSELVVMKACGVSLYRAAVPLFIFAAAASGVLFGLEELILSYSERQADRLNAQIRGYPTHTFGLVNRRWMIGTSGNLYHYEYFDSEKNRFLHLSTYHVDQRTWTLQALTYASTVTAQPAAGSGGSAMWRATNGWTREFGGAVRYVAFAARDLPLEPPGYFKTQRPESEEMAYGELKRYIAQLNGSGFDAIPQMVELYRKVAFPLVTIVITVLAVPFAVTTGRRGALYGVGVGIVLAIVYWITFSLFAAMGAGGLITPVLAAWAPNVLFGAAGAYLILTVRT